LRAIRLVQLQEQGGTSGGLGRVVGRTGGNKTRNQKDAQTQNNPGFNVLAMCVVFHNSFTFIISLFCKKLTDSVHNFRNKGQIGVSEG
jgi:hypothetical protein